MIIHRKSLVIDPYFGNYLNQLEPLMRDRSTVAQMAERAPRDRKVPSLNPALDPMRHVSNIIRNDDYNVIINSHDVWCIV